MVAIDVFVGRAEDPSYGVQGFKGQEVLDWQLRDGDDAESLGEVEIVYSLSVMEDNGERIQQYLDLTVSCSLDTEHQ